MSNEDDAADSRKDNRTEGDCRKDDPSSRKDGSTERTNFPKLDGVATVSAFGVTAGSASTATTTSVQNRIARAADPLPFQNDD